MSNIAQASHGQLSNALRALAMDAVQQANSGHPGMPMGMADVATVLFRQYLKFYAAHPGWHDRDRFVLSAGHGSMLLYGLLYCCGYPNFTLDELKNFRQFGSQTPGHPEIGGGNGVETTTGPLGQGLANAVGMALAERLLRAEFGESLCDHRTWVIAGDGCLMEGISHEAASLAGHLQLAKLTVLFDDNHISIDGDTTLSVSDDTLKRFEAYGWRTLSCDGHSPDDIANALKVAHDSDKPTLVACKTTIGYGAPNLQGTAKTHGAPLGNEEITAARKTLQWDSPPFVIPDDILAAWRNIGQQGRQAYDKWATNAKTASQAAEFIRRMQGDLPSSWEATWQQWRNTLTNDTGEAMATRQASGKTLEKLSAVLPELLGGSADLTGSNNTHVGQPIVNSTSTANGRYVHYGVREHGMAAAMNGIAAHGGFIPYGGTFLVFSDYCRPSIRLSAMNHSRVIYVMTHDSIGLGEDGPTHQPVEHLAALRAIPNLRVWRPCDLAETAECWRLAILRRDGPSLLALSRQGLPQISGYTAEQSARGGYVLSATANSTQRQLTIAASGSEVALAVATQQRLADAGIAAAVVSVPCLELLMQQDKKWLAQTIPSSTPLLTLEAAISTPWQALASMLGIERMAHIGVDSFGLSAPAKTVFAHFGLTPDNCAKIGQSLIN